MTCTVRFVHCSGIGINIIICRKAGLRLGQAEEKLKHEKFSGTTRAGVLPARCLRGKVLFNFVWFDVKLASCHFHPVFFVGSDRCLAPAPSLAPNNIYITPFFVLTKCKLVTLLEDKNILIGFY